MSDLKKKDELLFNNHDTLMSSQSQSKKKISKKPNIEEKISNASNLEKQSTDFLHTFKTQCCIIQLT